MLIRGLLVAGLLALLGAWSGAAPGAAIVISANTNWSTINTGSGPGGQPDATDTITINSGRVLTVDVTNGACSSMVIGSNTNTTGATLAFSAANSAVTVSGGITLGAGGGNRDGSINMTNGGTLTVQSFSITNLDTWTPGAGTVVLTANNTIPNNAGFATFNNFTVSAGTTTLSRTTTIAGNLLVNGTLAGAQTLNLTGNGQTIDGTGAVTNTGTLNMSTGSKSFPSTAALSFSGTIAIANGIGVTNNGAVTTTAAGGITGGNGASTWTNAAGSSLTISGPLMATGVLDASANPNTVNYAGAGQTVVLPSGAPATYYNLTLSGSGTVTMPGTAMTIANSFTTSGTQSSTAGAALTIGGPFALGSGTTFSASTFTHNLAGDFSHSGTFNANTSTFVFNGSASQALAGTATNTIFNSVTMSNAAGLNLPASHDLTVSGTLTLTSGNITTSTSNVVLGTAGTVATPSSSSYIAGNLRKTYSAGANLSFFAGNDFPVGDASNYAPVAITAGTAVAAGTLTVSTVAVDHPQLGTTSNIDDDNSVNRYWRLVSTMNVNAMSATFNFVAGDVDAGATPTSFVVQRYDQSAWNNTALVAANATNTQISNASFAAGTHDFAIGEALVPGASGQAGRFNVFQTATTAGAITGFIFTKRASVSVTDLDIVHVKQDRTGVQAGNVTVSIQIVDASAGGAVDLDSACNASWPVIQSLPGTLSFAGRTTIPAFTTLNNVYRDVRFKVTKTSGGSSQVGCSTDRFAIRPQSITITAWDANWRTAGTTRSLANTSATVGNVHAASTSSATTPRPFTLRAEPQPATATNYDGNPTVVASPTVYPICGALCTTPGSLSFTSATWSAAGSGVRENATANYSEVGTFQLQLEDGDFASVDASDGTPAVDRIVPSTATVTIGRFVPDRIEKASPSVPVFKTFAFSSACTLANRTFTYVGQPFWYNTLPSLTINAVNAAGTVTSNYRESLSLLKATMAESYSDNGVGPGYSLTGTTAFSKGNGTVAYSADASGRMQFTRSSAAPIVPFTANISIVVSAVDNTEVGPVGNPASNDLSVSHTFNGSGSGIAFDNGAEFRYGRLRLTNVAGPSNVDVPLTLRAEYYVSAVSGFMVNAADNCTTLAAGNFKLSGHQGGITPGNMPDGNVSISGALAAGVANLKLLKSNATTAGSVRICLDLDTTSATGDTTCQAATSAADQNYLQGPWTGSTYDKDPRAQATFGLYGSQPRNFIFFRENY
jgi:hypothetical protein